MWAVLLAALLGFAPAPLDPVVSVAWLNQHLHDRDVVILHVGRKVEYDKEHIAGARLIDGDGLENDMSGPTMDMSELPAPAAIIAKLERLGVSSGSQVVVVFSGKGVPAATRNIFLMRHAGAVNVALLDGGIEAWKRASLPVTTVVPVIAPARFAGAVPVASGVDFAWVQSHLDAPRVRVIDARDPVYYDGAAQGNMGMAAGHIPGARNIPFSSLIDDNGMLLPRSAIEAKFRAAGVQPGDTVLAYCHVGIQATVVVMSARLIGQPVRMYIGSFHDWSARKLATEGGKP